MTNVCIQKKDLKDGKYLKSNILSVNYKHYERERSFPYYRFMGKLEFETLLQEKIPIPRNGKSLQQEIKMRSIWKTGIQTEKIY